MKKTSLKECYNLFSSIHANMDDIKCYSFNTKVEFFLKKINDNSLFEHLYNFLSQLNFSYELIEEENTLASSFYALNQMFLHLKKKNFHDSKLNDVLLNNFKKICYPSEIQMAHYFFWPLLFHGDQNEFEGFPIDEK